MIPDSLLPHCLKVRLQKGNDSSKGVGIEQHNTAHGI